MPLPRPSIAGLAFAAIAATMLLAGCGRDAGSTRSLALADCHLPKVAQTLQCGTLDVPENRAAPDGRKIQIAVAVLPANTLSPKPDPLFILAGGPGQAASAVANVAALFTDIRATRDIVLVDQRGTGRSSPLDCKAFAPEHDLVAALGIDTLKQARACADELKARGVDAAQYTTSAFVEDLEAVRRALGYPRVNLWGGSYGTRVAQQYLRMHPDAIRSVTLDGVAPPSMIISTDIFPTRQKVLDGVIARCAAAPACNDANPDVATAMTSLREAIGDGKRMPITLPRTGRVVDAPLRWPAVVAAVHPLTYQPETAAMIPPILTAARQGNYTPLVGALGAGDDDADTRLNSALFYSVTCAEDVPRVTPERRAAALADPATRKLVDEVLAVCDFWPRGTLPADFATPVTSDVPVLLLSGGLDPVTPPAYADEVAKTLAHAKTITAPGFGHIISQRPCVPRMIGKFVDKAGFDTLPPACVAFLEGTSPPLVWTTPLGPKP
ncbi:MAG: alpha/beta fold hydrolase [Proteobacteria bacterium]|nr:alpha/beta fold hydrolase [Pseudomonadota bacterium]